MRARRLETGPRGWIPGRGIRRVAWCAVALLTCVVLLASPGSNAARDKNKADRVARTDDANDLLIVDCLLPGRVRQLGRRSTYVEARRPARIAAVECEIRGGEYTAYDRASLSTALAVWRDQAEAGDPQAQTYVGEMFEKGLGVPPDHAAAAAWYRRAAERGFAAAQINLGHLYEKGLGVERDPVEALRWYRAASGLPEAVVLETAGSDADLDELARLREQTGRLEARTRELEERAERLEREARASRAELEAARERERTLLDDLREGRRRLEQLERAQGTSASDREEIDRLRTDLAERESEVERNRIRVAELEGAVGSLEARLADAATVELELREQKKRVEDVTRERDEIARTLADLSEQLEQRERNVADLETRLEAARQEIESSESSEARVSELKDRLADSERELRARRQEIVELEEASRRYRERLGDIERAREEAERRRQLEVAAGDIAGPTIELIDPPVLRTRGIEVVRASAAERVLVGRVDAPAGLLSFLVDGVERPEALDAHGLFKVPVPVTGSPTRVTFAAVDLQGKRTALELDIVSAEAATGNERGPETAPALPAVDFGRYHAIIIGNNDYAHFPDLHTAVNDARAIGGILETRYGFRTRVLVDASRHEILTALNEAARDLTEKDNLLIYYAGHGELLPQIQKGYWLPVDAERDNPANWISTSTITDYLGTIPARHILVVADSCYSGSLTRSALARLEQGMSAEARREWLRKMVGKKCRTALTSGGLEPVLDAGGGGHSVFAKALIDVLADNAEVLAGRRLYDHVAARVAYAAEAMGVDQVPEYAPIRYAQHESGDFFFVPDGQRLD